jgi:hypothetical protein
MNNTNDIGREMTNAEAIAILAQVKSKLGRNYKRAIRSAWYDGDYDGEGLGEWDSSLQRIRNTFGPTWLVNARA